MASYVVRISKTIDMTAVVEADSQDEAYGASISFDHVLSIDDAGWDVVWDAYPLDFEPTYMTTEEVFAPKVIV
jgi:hypothetical protein